MTSASLDFITPLSMELASGRRPLTGFLDEPLSHVKVPEGADLMVIAPATANIMGKMANGLADCLLSASYMAFRGKTMVAPAMNTRMYEHPAFRRNLETLKARGVIEVPPECGMLACGTEGRGRMASVECIVEAAIGALTGKDFEGRRVLVTAGPTREPIDPVRFISNHSSGKMGYALAKMAARRGAEVVLVSGPSALDPPWGLKDFMKVDSTGQMRDAVLGNAAACDMVIMAAAPADFTPEKPSDKKIAKTDCYYVKLKATHDILAELGRMSPRPFLVGFAAETGGELSGAKKKLEEKGADMIVFNDVTAEGAGFDTDTNRVTILDRDGAEKELPLMGKEDVANAVLDAVSALAFRK
jgi:phosphopantothenoylcysteine decarboxylase/phosphopantothenate--cysteine ligase